MELISVVVIAYNEAEIIKTTLDSIYHQTYPRLELIVTDDFSRDDTVRVVTEWMHKNAERFERAVVVTSTCNTGVSANVNRGIQSISGRYFATVAGDDIWYPEKISLEFDYLISNGYDMVFSKIDVIGKNELAVKELRNFCEEGYRSIEAGYVEQKKMILKHNIVAGPSWGVRTKESYDKMGGFDEAYPFLDDYPYLYRYIMNGGEIHLLDKVLAQYNLGDTNLSKSRNKLFEKSEMDFILKEKVYGLLKEKMYFELSKQIPWDRQLRYEARVHELLVKWLKLKRRRFSLDNYFNDRGVGSICVAGDERLREAAMHEFSIIRAINSKKLTEEIIVDADTTDVVDAYLICDQQLDECETQLVLNNKPVYWVDRIIEDASKAIGNCQIALEQG